jgi:D-glycero-D-manno-heptose 1,7-bisphosphate phosphatase
MSIRLIIFDRDGTLNKRIPNSYVLNRSEIILPSDSSALNPLCRTNIRIAVATNQACVGKGLISVESVTELTQEICKLIFGELTVDVFICPHFNLACECRKPKPGLLHSAMSEAGTTKSETLFIGDSWSDAAAARAAGVQFLGVCWDGKCLVDNCMHTLSGVAKQLMSLM